ncbi:uncharacterized zinc-type alcohol dehydrogenase-like protein [Jatrophihabitans sp. GAS493]|uniref:NAD(P)-dependent alcohol dehydrogenase n=1 Tax=Jatrophihabitans sp. GAS493 TaxID=1907575 RepID=UPI000BB6789F|nr:NAD(P)-dependent alcohol dehydrogenase [Jatrophihabitans sp. GAS493]SOD74758.1 uncharacterized zinc-type alcohol dehydrogenase-like protein [Jatrophihabitans sp. GAS493]
MPSNAISTWALAVPAVGEAARPTSIDRRAVGPHDVAIDIKFVGICHTDIHQVNGDWGRGTFPMVPGHEIAGVVSAVGAQVTKFAVGDRVGVGCFVDSCAECEYCLAGEEQFCVKGVVSTYNSRGYDGEPTYGGYSQAIVVTDRFVVRIPDSLPLDAAAPLLCAGITVFSPLKRYDAATKKVAIVGMGGLGHVAIKIAHAMGADVTVLSQTLAKQADGLAYGAGAYYATSDPATFKQLSKQFDVILNTVSVNLDVNNYLRLLRIGGAIVNLGIPAKPDTFSAGLVVGSRRSITGSNVGGIAETQEMLDFCAEHGITADIELIDATQVSEAYERILASQVRYRFVIDVATIPAS